MSQAAVPDTGQAGALRVTVDQAVGFRANLGLVKVAGVPASVAIEIFPADGQAAPGSSSFTVELSPYAMTQLKDVLARLDPGQGQGPIIRAAVVSPQGAVLAYLSEVDNLTNDASYQEPLRFGY